LDRSLDFFASSYNDLAPTEPLFALAAPDFAAKRLKIIAQGFSPWVSQLKNRALKVAPDARVTDGVNTRRPERTPLGRHFQGVSFGVINPGLKPWTVIYSRFAAKSDRLSRGGFFA
jgi:hypothetical protein